MRMSIEYVEHCARPNEGELDALQVGTKVFFHTFNYCGGWGRTDMQRLPTKVYEVSKVTPTTFMLKELPNLIFYKKNGGIKKAIDKTVYYNEHSYVSHIWSQELEDYFTDYKARWKKEVEDRMAISQIKWDYLDIDVITKVLEMVNATKE